MQLKRQFLNLIWSFDSALTWRNTIPVSVQYLWVSSPPCNRTTEFFCRSLFCLRRSHSRLLFKANSATGTFKVSFPSQKEGLEKMFF